METAVRRLKEQWRLRGSDYKTPKIWKNQTVTSAVKIRFINILVFWTFGLWVYGLLRIFWTEHRTNVSILTELNIRDRLL